MTPNCPRRQIHIVTSPLLSLNSMTLMATGRPWIERLLPVHKIGSSRSRSYRPALAGNLYGVLMIFEMSFEFTPHFLPGVPLAQDICATQRG